ncbi:MAG: hypothetical protein II943_02255 [Victivallales bacterium]|nr:hypothetical protein [Victivallales bacterium]
MKKLSMLFLAAMLAFSSVGIAGEETGAQGNPPVQSQVVTQKDPVKQLRGKLLYKRNQIRKLERAALAVDPALEAKVEQLENERQSLYVAVKPELEELYAAEKELLNQIDAAKSEK